MFDDDPRGGDPRERDDDARDMEVHWIDLGRGPSDAPREREEDLHERDRDTRSRDPRDAFLHGLDLPRGLERELVLDGDHRYELNREDSRTLATTGAFRLISERDLFKARDQSLGTREEGLRDLRDQGLIRTVSLDGRERAVTLTERGRHLLDVHRREREDARQQAFYAGIDRPRELRHDAALYRAYLREEQSLREQGADIRRVVLEHELKREYQCFLQERNRDRPDSDGRPDRDRDEIEEWARAHDLPYFDDAVHFPDFRIEYEVNGLERHEDVEVLTAHYRGAHATSRARAGFTCYGRSSRSGGHPFDPDVAGRLV